MAARCLDENAVLAFLDGRLSGPSLGEVEAHLLACDACNELVTCAAADLGQPSRPAGGEQGPRLPLLGQLLPGAAVGRYRILGAVGRGGMGEVYAAYHPDLDRRIALKVVHEGGATQSERRARLLREARAIARLSHPNVVTVYDAGVFGDRVYIAMELFEGQTLERWLRDEARGWREIVDAFIAAGRGLAAAHAAGVIHRDFKPGNVMIGRDASVRVMDFGLARLAEEGDAIAGESDPAASRPVFPTTVTKTGAFLGTPAYMSPEQFGGAPIDPRSDQFSFCVGLHEALTGTRPPLPHLPTRPDRDAADDTPKPLRRPGIPAWLRQVLARGLADKREQRYPSMDHLLNALARGRTRLRRRLGVAAATSVILLASLGGWGLARGGRVTCALPKERLAGAWTAPDGKERIRRAFVASGHGAAGAIWQRVSSALDQHVARWGAMYVETCQATHVRGEQSPEVLDLRMACLHDNLDQVRALSGALAAADRSAVSRAIAAVTDLTPVARCADVGLLRAAVPLPKDDRTLRAVLALRRSVAEVEALREIGNERAALAKALALRPAVEALGHPPLVGRTLESIAHLIINAQPAESERLLEQAFVSAQAGRDDEGVARIASHLTYLVGYSLGRYVDSERWNRIANATLDRLGPGHGRMRAWAHHSFAVVLLEQERYQDAAALLDSAIALKAKELGPEHPDLAISLTALGWAAIELGEFERGLAADDRAIAILAKVDPNHAELANAFNNRGEALRLLDRYDEAESASQRALAMLTAEFGPLHRFIGHPLHNLGEIQIAKADPTAALQFLERARAIRERDEAHPIALAETQFALARALAAAKRDPQRVRGLSAAALETFRTHKRPKKEQAVVAWRMTAKTGSRSIR